MKLKNNLWSWYCLPVIIANALNMTTILTILAGMVYTIPPIVTMYIEKLGCFVKNYIAMLIY